MPTFHAVAPHDHAAAHNKITECVDGVQSLIEAQAIFSLTMFGTPDFRGPAAVLDHVRKEVEEVAHDPMNREEWADLVILALDGLQRATWQFNQQRPRGQLAASARVTLTDKMRRNFGRDWPALEEQDPTRAVEHVRSEAELHQKAVELADDLRYPIPPKPATPMRGAPPAAIPADHVKAFNQLAHFNAIAKIAGYESLAHFMLTALAELGHVVEVEGGE